MVNLMYRTRESTVEVGHPAVRRKASCCHVPVCDSCDVVGSGVSFQPTHTYVPRESGIVEWAQGGPFIAGAGTAKVDDAFKSNVNHQGCCAPSNARAARSSRRYSRLLSLSASPHAVPSLKAPNYSPTEL